VKELLKSGAETHCGSCLQEEKEEECKRNEVWVDFEMMKSPRAPENYD
jgi:hypothetical protein